MSGNNHYAIKSITGNNASHSRIQRNYRPMTIQDYGNNYILVPIHTVNSTVTKKQIKELTNSYQFSETKNNSFVLCSKHYPQTRIAIPYYYARSHQVHGKPSVEIMNFYPKSTILATPPAGQHVAGKTAKLVQVDQKALNSLVTFPEINQVDLYSNTLSNKSTSNRINDISIDLTQSNTGNTVNTNKSHSYKYPYNSLLHATASTTTSSVTSSSYTQSTKQEKKTVSSSLESDPSKYKRTLSGWSTNNVFECSHMPKKYKTDQQPQQNITNDTMYKEVDTLVQSLISILQKEGSIAIESIPTMFSKSYIQVEQILHMLYNLQILTYRKNIQNSKDKGIYTLNCDEKCPVPLDIATLSKQLQQMSNENKEAEERIKYLEQCAQNPQMDPSLVYYHIQDRMGIYALPDPLYSSLSKLLPSPFDS